MIHDEHLDVISEHSTASNYCHFVCEMVSHSYTRSHTNRMNGLKKKRYLKCDECVGREKWMNLSTTANNRQNSKWAAFYWINFHDSFCHFLVHSSFVYKQYETWTMNRFAAMNLNVNFYSRFSTWAIIDGKIFACDLFWVLWLWAFRMIVKFSFIELGI